MTLSWLQTEYLINCSLDIDVKYTVTCNLDPEQQKQLRFIRPQIVSKNVRENMLTNRHPVPQVSVFWSVVNVLCDIFMT